MSSSSPTLTPALDHTVHFVLCDFGPNGTAYVETDTAQADEMSIIRAVVTGEYDRPLRVIACNPAEGWCRDVSAQIAASLVDVEELSDGARAFAEMHATSPKSARLSQARSVIDEALNKVEDACTAFGRASNLADLTGMLPVRI